MPPGHCDVAGFALGRAAVSTLGVQRSKNPLLTLTGFFFASNDMLSGVPLLKPFAERYAMKPSLNREQMYAGHSLEKKLKSNLTPVAFAGAFSVELRGR